MIEDTAETWTSPATTSVSASMPDLITLSPDRNGVAARAARVPPAPYDIRRFRL
jgi:hypothetical protein